MDDGGDAFVALGRCDIDICRFDKSSRRVLHGPLDAVFDNILRFDLFMYLCLGVHEREIWTLHQLPLSPVL